jgi:hypothetical protein
MKNRSITSPPEVELTFAEAKMHKKMKWIGLLIAAVMLMAATVPVFADTGEEPVVDPVVVAEETSSFLNHPIIKLLASFFSNLFQPAVEEPVEGDDVVPPPSDGTEDDEGLGDEGEGTVEDPLPVIVPEEVIAELHEGQDLGFGEITKLLQIVVEAQASCTLEGVNCDVTLEGLVAEYKAGVGMGELFQKYGKPDLLGVGHVRKAADLKEKSNNGKAYGKNK